MVIYLATNTVNGKCYVGQHKTKDVQSRWKAHCFEALRGTGWTMPFHSAIRKYGVTAFTIKVIAHAKTQKELNKLEAFHIKRLGTYPPGKRGYNMTKGGDGISGYHHTDATKAKLRVKAIVRMKGAPQFYSQLGRKHTDATKAKMSLTRKGHGASPETIAKMTAAKIGKPRSAETKAKISAACLGYKHTPEAIIKIGNAARGRPNSPSARAKIAIARKAYWVAWRIANNRPPKP